MNAVRHGEVERPEGDHFSGCHRLILQWESGRLAHLRTPPFGKGDIRTRLLAHLNGDNACITRERPPYFVAAVTDDMDQLEKQLILELKPICNKRVG
ncbi:MAG TPA: hypothetical protein VG013_23965 [Gemmataceae bacterium]|nr:hypothetical protein [Gemmataceae bacterium]